MKKSVDELQKKDRKDTSLHDRYDEHEARWKKLTAVMDNIHLELKQLPERWKEHHAK